MFGWKHAGTVLGASVSFLSRCKIRYIPTFRGFPLLVENIVMLLTSGNAEDFSQPEFGQPLFLHNYYDHPIHLFRLESTLLHSGFLLSMLELGLFPGASRS